MTMHFLIEQMIHVTMIQVKPTFASCVTFLATTITTTDDGVNSSKMTLPCTMTSILQSCLMINYNSGSGKRYKRGDGGLCFFKWKSVLCNRPIVRPRLFQSFFFPITHFYHSRLHSWDASNHERATLHWFKDLG